MMLIIAIWLGIIGILIKTDVGGFGSTVLAPIFKDVPVINKILPNSVQMSTETEGTAYSTVDEAVERIKELEIQIDTLNAQAETDKKTIEELKGRLKSYVLDFRNTLPPRYLWKGLWKLYRTDTAALVEECRQKQQSCVVEDYFA